jgi:predicted Rossmann-fold nucleotide-binding protein
LNTVQADAGIDARITPSGSLENLSQSEMALLEDRSQGGLYPLFRRCALAVLNSGSLTDDPMDFARRYENFEIRVVRKPWGVRLELKNAPSVAFVDGHMIKGVNEHLSSVLRDVVYHANEITDGGRVKLTEPHEITNAIFCILRHAGVLKEGSRSNLIVGWGGHSIPREEYDYTKRVGYELGIRGLDVCTGCGPGAMKGPMKGATIGHSKQRITDGRYIGLTEPSIVAAESPNPIVSQLVILPDIEKRLEAFVRIGHGFIIFPGGAGTAEEILFLLGVLLDPANAQQHTALVLTGPESARAWLEQIHEFIGLTLGAEAQARYRIIIEDPAAVARAMADGISKVRRYRRQVSDAFNFNWTLAIPPAFQLPFEVSHESIEGLRLHLDQPVHERAANLRRIFSAIVAGNIKSYGMQMIAEKGPFKIHGDPRLMKPLDSLLAAFVAQGRMKLSGEYRPVYQVVT